MRWVWACLPALLLAPLGSAQSTQGLILGRITDSITGLPLRTPTTIESLSEDTQRSSKTITDANGYYSLPSLSPGLYRITASAADYQSQQARALQVPVAGRVELNLRLRPLTDIWEAGQSKSWLLQESKQAVAFFGPDVDPTRVAVFNANRGAATPLENSRSDVIASDAIVNLPLTGRDVYTMLLLLPGVAADTATARGLGFSVNGQRPSSSNYLLDGAENNNLLVTGPLNATAPEFIQEYRISTTHYSAEYGRTSGFVANAISRSGSNDWHGTGYFYFKSDRLNASDFQSNAQGFARKPFTELQPGGIASGPLVRDRLQFAVGFQSTRSRGRNDPQVFALPTDRLVQSTDASSFAGRLLRRYRPEASGAGTGNFGPAAIAAPTSVQRNSALMRLDYSVTPANYLFIRLLADTSHVPELVFNPYREFSTPFRQRTISLAAGAVTRMGPAAQNEFRIARGGDTITAETSNRDLPAIVVGEFIPGVGRPNPVRLPGNTNNFDYAHRGRTWELVDNYSRIMGRHTIKFGGGLLQRTADLHVAVYPLGYLLFFTLDDFLQSRPALLQAQVDRTSNSLAPVSPDRLYRYRQSYGFVQASSRAGQRLTFDYGVRYEFFGSPVNIGTEPDLLIRLGPGGNIRESLANARQELSDVNSGRVYDSRRGNWAVRMGGAWDVTGTGRTLLRGSYGIFYDRLFDNQWENIIQNRYKTGAWSYTQPVTLPASLDQLEAAGEFQSSSELIPGLAFQPGLRAPRVHSSYLAVQQKLAPGLNLEVNGLVSRGRQLITTDQINRPYSVQPTSANPFGYIQPAFANYINYRANQGSSDYAALIASLKVRRARWSGQASYTWSHSIDNQSESLAGTFFDLNTFPAAQRDGSPFLSSFTRQFASSLDRGNSDFDQRHNLVFYGTYSTRPQLRSWRRVLGSWTLSTLGAVRTGLPYTVYAPADFSTFPPEFVVNQRANIVNPAQAATSAEFAGGRRLLNAAAFAKPGPNTVGNTGRNAFTGPGLFNLDASIARGFAIPRVSESARIVLRADFYNLLNHANLNNPSAFLGSANFGVALYGRREANSGFPLLAPLSESARQVQLMIRLQF